MRQFTWYAVLLAALAHLAQAQLLLNPVPPCRMVDTRPEQGKPFPYGAPNLSANTERDFPMLGAGPCFLPQSALAFSLNVTPVPLGPLNSLAVWPTGQPYLGLSTLETPSGNITANAVLAPAGANGSIAIDPSNATHVIVDVNGYFSPGSGLAFYPMTPCRVVDTRSDQGKNGTPFGPPSLVANAGRIFPVSSSPCGIPANAQAYSFNVTVVPQGPMEYLSIWPANQGYPYVSTLNSTDGGVIANAAIVPAGDGRTEVVAGSPTDLIIDINGYFAPGGGMYFYPIPPCRAVDTRSTGVLQPYVGQNFAITSGRCPIPGSAQAFSFNVTALPQGGPLGFLSIWPAGQPYPYVSTLNSYFGNPISNAALVPAGTGGSITMAAGNPTHVLADANGYFSYSPYEGNYVGVSGAVVSSGPAGTPQQFTAHYTGPAGWWDVPYGQMLFTTDPSGPNGINACQIEWNTAGNLNLISPDGNVYSYFGGPQLANNSCSVDSANSRLTQTTSGYDVTVRVTFGAGFPSSTPVQAYAYGENASGLSGPWVNLGSWTQNSGPTSGTTSGTPPPPDIPTPPPDITPPPTVSGSYQACTEDISGGWTDAFPSTYSLSETGGVISGTLVQSPLGCVGIWQVGGQYSGAGPFTITFTPAQQFDACGNLEGGGTATVQVTSCSTATITPDTGGQQTGAAPFSAGASVGSGTQADAATYTWTRTSNPPGVQVTLNLYNGTASANLTGQNKTGPLSIILNGAGNSVSIGSQSNAQTSQTYNFPLTRSSLPLGSYTNVVATWDNLSVNAPVSFTVLGLTRFSTYNVPHESACNGFSDDPVYVFMSNRQTCDWVQTSIDSQFYTQTKINGTGLSRNYGLIKPWGATNFRNSCALPPNAIPGGANTFVQVPSVTGTCNKTLYAGQSVATNPSPNPPNGTWNCSDKILLVNPSGDRTDSMKAVQDACPACSSGFNGTNGHIDSYSDAPVCTPPFTDYGNFFTIRLR